MSDVPDLSSDEDQSNEEDWTEIPTEDSHRAVCLFCDSDFPAVDNALRHCETQHGFKLTTLRLKHNMDDYSYIKLINYIKIHKPEPSTLMAAQNPLWNDDIYLKPVHNDDWLMYDFESADDNPELEESPQGFHANVENGLVTLSEGHFTELQKTIRDLAAQAKEKDHLLTMAHEDMETMKKSMSVLVNGADAGSGDSQEVNCVANVALEDDEGYFNSYAHFSIHHTMLSDKVRTESYRSAILSNSSLLKDAVVLDLGCGTGILSMFAATAGARTVYALDQSEVVYHAMDIIRENNLHDSVQVIKGRLENTKLEQKVDFIISEWMGYFLLFEGMLDSVIYARDNCLKPGGQLLPNRCNISLVGNGDVESHSSLISFWSNVYGYKMNCMKTEVVREASIEVVDSKHIITEPCIVKEIDINTSTTDVVDFTSTFSLPVIKDGVLTSLVGYFDTFFDLPAHVQFSTGPQSAATHWKQTVFYFKDCRPVKAGDVVTGTISCNRSKADVRALSVQIELYGKLYKFVLS